MDLTTNAQIRHYEHNANQTGRDFIVGDLHGMYEQFNQALTHLEFDQHVDRVFSVGDLIDRGPDNVNCALLLNQTWFHAVRGNHEQLMIDSVIGTDHEGVWIGNGGRWAFQQITRNERIEIAKMFNQLPWVITVGSGANRFNVCHAEMAFAPDITDDDIDAIKIGSTWNHPLIWGRDIIQRYTPPCHSDRMSITYVGHTPVNQPTQAGKHIYLDGGAVFNRKLIIADHTNQQIHTFNIANQTTSTIDTASVYNMYE